MSGESACGSWSRGGCPSAQTRWRPVGAGLGFSESPTDRMGHVALTPGVRRTRTGVGAGRSRPPGTGRPAADAGAEYRHDGHRELLRPDRARRRPRAPEAGLAARFAEDRPLDDVDETSCEDDEADDDLPEPELDEKLTIPEIKDIIRKRNVGRTKTSVPPKLKLSGLKKGELLQLLRDDDEHLARIAAAAASPDETPPAPAADECATA